MGFLIFVLFALVFLMIIAAISSSADQEKEQKRKEARERRQKELEEKREEKKKIYETKKSEQALRLGEADKVIALEEYDIDKEITVFGESKTIVLLGNEFSFSDIIDCTTDDDYKVIKGKTEYTSETKAKNGSTVGRAIVGGVLAGGAGAIIGGATAKKETKTITHQKDDIIIHNYIVVVNVNSLSSPIITISLGGDKAKLNEIVGVLNVIINNNRVK